MKKTIFLLSSFIIIIIFSFILLKSPSVVFAGESKPAMHWHCLDAIQCSEPGANCPLGEGAVAGHRAKLTTKPDDLPARNKQTYVFVCIATEQGSICTTGDSRVDMATVEYDGVAQLQKSTATGGFVFQGLFRSDGRTPVPADQIVSNAQGKLTVGGQVVEPLYWQDYTPKGVGRKWLALNLIDPIPVEMGAGGQQQGTFTFEEASGKCVEIQWDPYGIVFDSQSLEPVYGVRVSLLKKRDSGQFTLVGSSDAVSILNPFVTKEDGSFFFYVPDGTYRLEVEASNFVFPNDPLKLNNNYSEFYSDIYRGQDIVQRGKIVHHDIPIDAKGSPYTAPVKLMSYFPLLDKSANFLILQGRVSHPKTTINVYAKKPAGEGKFARSGVILSGVADKQGHFDLRIDLNKLGPNEFVGDLELIKNPLMGQSQSQSNRGFFFRFLSKIKGVSAQDNSTFFSIEPIFNHLEGYAYDDKGRPLPNTTVGVYLNFSNKSLYETKTDKNGYFRIPSEYLPPMSYYIKYITPTGFSRSITLSKFVLDNNQYLIEKKANLHSFKNMRGQTLTPQPPISTPTYMWMGKRNGQMGGDSGEVNITQPTNNRSQINVLVVTGVILLFLIMTVVGIIYFYKKNQQRPL